MTEQQFKKSSFSFFVDTYKAKNIARAKPSINYHFDAIKENLSEILNHLGANESKNVKKSIEKSIESSNDQSPDLLQKSIVFGESFKTALLMLKNTPHTDESNKKLINATIYHYLELAESIKDKNINSLAIEIAKIAKASN